MDIYDVKVPMPNGMRNVTVDADSPKEALKDAYAKIGQEMAPPYMQIGFARQLVTETISPLKVSALEPKLSHQEVLRQSNIQVHNRTKGKDTYYWISDPELQAFITLVLQNKRDLDKSYSEPKRVK